MNKKSCALRIMSCKTWPESVKDRFSWSCACGDTESGISSGNMPAWEAGYQSYLEHRSNNWDADAINAKEQARIARETERAEITAAAREAAQRGEEIHSQRDYCNNPHACCGQRGGKICHDCPNLTLRLR